MRSAGFRVYGTITDTADRPLAGVRVRAFDRDLASEDDELGEALTDSAGRFRICFERGAFSRGFERRPDLYLRLEDSRSCGELRSTRRRTRWRAAREEWFELSI